MPTPTAWEYTVLVLTSEQMKTIQGVQDVLNELGRDGWEHYDIRPYEKDDGNWEQRYYFKRPK